MRFEWKGRVMRSELHRDQVTDPQTIHDNLRDAAYHEAGHVVVARFLGLTVREVEIEEDGSGRANIGPSEHLPLGDQIALCVAGIMDVPTLGFTQPHGVLNHCVENGLQVGGRRANDLEHVGGGSLLLTRLFQFACESGDLLLGIGGGYAHGVTWA